MSDIFIDFDKKNEVPKHKTDLADEITQALGINGVYVSVGLTNKEMHLDKLNFSEHDKVFEDKIVELETLLQKQDEFLDMKNLQIDELKQQIAELESNETSELPFDPLECANYLINATYERETSSFEKSLTGDAIITRNRYSIDELEQIAEHLLVYCKHNKETE